MAAYYPIYFRKYLSDCSETAIEEYLVHLHNAFNNRDSPGNATVQYSICFELISLDDLVKNIKSDFRNNDLYAAFHSLIKRYRKPFHHLTKKGRKWKESWSVVVYFTMIPNVKCTLRHTSLNKNKVTSEIFLELSEYLLHHELADEVGHTAENTEELGTALGHYLFHKISGIKSLRDMLKLERIRGTESLLKNFMDSAGAVLLPAKGEPVIIIELPYDDINDKEFICKCDQHLLDVWGEKLFEE